MKILKLLSICFALSLCLTACDDDDNEVPGEGNAVNVPQVAVAFDKEEMTVLKNAGEIQIPVVLAQAAEGPVRLTIAVKEQTDNTAAEGIDFDLKEKVITIAKGNTIGYVSLTLYDNNKADTDKSFALEIKNVYDYGKAADTKQNCTVHIVSNAFAEFQYANRETYEAAGTYQIPLIITGEIKTATTLTVRVKEGGTALEGTHFTIPNTQITIAPGATSANIEIALVDDKDANNDRWFDLEITEIQGSNAIIGSQKICRMTIISEEVAKSVAFADVSYSVQEGQILFIPIALDKAPAAGEEEVVVTLSIKTANSTAIENTDFTIETKEIRFIPGQKESEIKITTIPNNEVDADRDFELSIKAVTGANMGTPDICKVSIKNDDFPSFDTSVSEVKEGMGNYPIEITIPAVDRERILKITTETTGNNPENFFKNIPTEIVVPARAEKVSFQINIDIDRNVDIDDLPTLIINLTEVDHFILETPISKTLQLKGWPYRRCWGNYTFYYSLWDGTNWAARTTDMVISNNDNEDNNDKILIGTGEVEGTAVTYQFIFDHETQKISLFKMNVNIAAGITHNWSNNSSADIPVTMNNFDKFIIECGGGYTSWSNGKFIFTNYLERK